MPTPDRARDTARLLAILWFLAATFSVVAVVIRYRRTGEIAWYLLAAAAFTFVMGVSSLKRSRPPAR